MEHFPTCSQEAGILFLGRNLLYSRNEKCHLGKQMFYVVVSCPSLHVYIYIYHLHNMLSIYTYIHITYITHNLSNIHTSALEYHLIDFWL